MHSVSCCLTSQFKSCSKCYFNSRLRPLSTAVNTLAGIHIWHHKNGVCLAIHVYFNTNWFKNNSSASVQISDRVEFVYSEFRGHNNACSRPEGQSLLSVTFLRSHDFKTSCN